MADKYYVVQTVARVVQRCILMTTDPGDLVLDPTCGSGTTAYVAEQWGRRWITLDTSRVALALARQRLMSARFPFYYLADSKDGRAKEQEVSGKIQPETSTGRGFLGDIRHGFVYERAPHIMLSSIARNAEIDIIWETYQTTLEPLRAELNMALKKSWEEWEIPREADASWPDAMKKLHAAWWEARIERQKKIDDSIKKNADIEYLYDRPYVDSSKVRVTGPFTVESLSPHRVIPSDEDAFGEELAAPPRGAQLQGALPPEASGLAGSARDGRTAGTKGLLIGVTSSKGRCLRRRWSSHQPRSTSRSQGNRNAHYRFHRSRIRRSLLKELLQS